MQGKFQSAVGELMEINGLIEGIADKEKDLEERQNFTALKIEKAMKNAGDVSEYEAKRSELITALGSMTQDVLEMDPRGKTFF